MRSARRTGQRRTPTVFSVLSDVVFYFIDGVVAVLSVLTWPIRFILNLFG
ncbi:MAG: hypothetical protein Q7T71_09335 [Herbiconiux sp.]|nr:hypothetical protein [Herbiconiux sp.]